MIDLRDYFAAKAMQAMLNSLSDREGVKIIRKKLAKNAYDFSDAMLAERERNQLKAKVL